MAPATPQHTDSMQWVPRFVPVACAEGGEPERGCHHSLYVATSVGQAPAAAQPSRKSLPSAPDANPVQLQEVAGTVVRHGWVPLGPTERPPGARQTCFWALFQRSRANHSWDEPRIKREKSKSITQNAKTRVETQSKRGVSKGTV